MVVAPKNDLPKRTEILWHDAISNIQFAKTQQWRITNYALLILAAIFALDKSMGSKELSVNLTLTPLTFLVLLFAFHFIRKFAEQIEKNRNRLAELYRHFSCREQNAYQVDPEKMRGKDPNEIGWSLIFILVVSVIIDLLAIWNLLGSTT